MDANATEAGVRLELASLVTEAERLAAHVDVVAQHLDAPDAARLQGTVSELLSRLATEVGRLQQLRRDPTGTS